MKKFYLPATVLVCIVACLAGRNDLSTLIQQGIAIGLVAYLPKKVPEIEDKVLVSDQGTWVAFSIVAFLYLLFSCLMPFAPMTNGALPDGVLAVPAYFIRAIYCAVVVYYEVANTFRVNPPHKGYK